MNITAHDTFHGGAPACVFDEETGPPPEDWVCPYCDAVSQDWARLTDKENVRIYERDPEDEGKWECGICGSLHWAPNMPDSNGANTNNRKKVGQNELHN